jgi:hypothetical protein
MLAIRASQSGFGVFSNPRNLFISTCLSRCQNLQQVRLTAKNAKNAKEKDGAEKSKKLKSLFLSCLFPLPEILCLSLRSLRPLRFKLFVSWADARLPPAPAPHKNFRDAEGRLDSPRRAPDNPPS